MGIRVPPTNIFYIEGNDAFYELSVSLGEGTPDTGGQFITIKNELNGDEVQFSANDWPATRDQIDKILGLKKWTQ